MTATLSSRIVDDLAGNDIGFVTTVPCKQLAGVIDAIEKGTPMRRLGKPVDIAPAVTFLASDGAGFITGEAVAVDGGVQVKATTYP